MRDLSLTLDIRTEDERLVAQSAADFHAGKGGVRRARGLRGQVPGFCRTTWSEMAALGWTGLCIAERWGGNAAPLGHALALAGEMGRSLAPEPLVAATALAGGVLAASEHLTLSDEWLPRLSDGTWIPALGWQEPGRGQDLLPLCRAETASDGDVVIDGEKCFVPQGAGADAFIVSVLQNGDDERVRTSSLRHKALFAVDDHIAIGRCLGAAQRQQILASPGFLPAESRDPRAIRETRQPLVGQGQMF